MIGLPPLVQTLPGDRLHLQHGPIDVILRAWGAEVAVREAYAAVSQAFPAILPALAAERDALRQPIAQRPKVSGPVATRMVAACRPHAPLFVTPMAAVAGAVADHLMEILVEAAPIDRAFVNDGGDIAVHLTEGETLTIGLMDEVDRGRIPPRVGSVTLRHGDGIGGVATSGAGGRSFSLGIADAVTVLARTAAAADVAASLIANAVDLPGHAGIMRQPARWLDPDSDLEDLPVTVSVGDLTGADVDQALAAGLAEASRLMAARHIHAAALSLRGRTVATGGVIPAAPLG